MYEPDHPRGWAIYETVGIIPASYQEGINLIKNGFNPSIKAIEEIKLAHDKGLVSNDDIKMLMQKHIIDCNHSYGSIVKQYIIDEIDGSKSMGFYKECILCGDKYVLREVDLEKGETENEI